MASTANDAEKLRSSQASANGGDHGYRRRSNVNMHDPSVTIEEYMYHASIARQHPSEQPGASSSSDQGTFGNLKQSLFGKNNKAATAAVTDEKNDGSNQDASAWANVADDEWVQASRAVRTASWGAVFYLITTDILGPFTVS